MVALRLYRPDDAPALLALFQDTVRSVNSRDYSPVQVAAWASDDIDMVRWFGRFEERFVLVAEARRAGIRRLFTKASITARPFFEAQGFVVLTPQVVTVRGVEFVNYRMERIIAEPSAAADRGRM